MKLVEIPLRDNSCALIASRAVISPSIDLGKNIYLTNESDMISSFFRKDTHNKRDGRGDNASEPRDHYQKV
jgi:hypothetical protein